MELHLPKTSVNALAGQTVFEVFHGAETYSSARIGETVKITCADGAIEGTLTTLDVGPLGKFLAPSYSHLSNVGRAFDVRAIVDNVEERYDAKKFPKAVDPRTLYTYALINLGMPLPQPAQAA